MSPDSSTPDSPHPRSIRVDIARLAEILDRGVTRWLDLRPRGFEVETGHCVTSVRARLVRYGAARTLYVKRRPVCRSLDGVASSHPVGRRCPVCTQRDRCTTQIRLDLVIEGRPYRILLAPTSARNFLEYATELGERGVALEGAVHVLRARRRGSWTEVCFELEGPA